MKEIKYRIWNPRHKEFQYWGFMGRGFMGIPTGAGFTVDECKNNSQQFTGLKDKNGKEIYEGDIVRNSFGKVVIEWKGEMWTEEGFITGFSELFEGANCYEIVGNIFEEARLNAAGSPASSLSPSIVEGSQK